MGKAEIQKSLLFGNLKEEGDGASDVESQAAEAVINGRNSRVSSVDEEYVALADSGDSGCRTEEWSMANPEWTSDSRPRRSRSSIVVGISVCCIAAILFLGAAFVTYDSLSQEGRVFTISGPDGENEFFRASHTGYHFQPAKNWMNDPNAPLYYKGYYHFFYQYNPEAAVWGQISWGHAVSKDLVHWTHLEPALKPDKWYDAGGVWSGSATILEDGTPAILYTAGRVGMTGIEFQSQALALPVDPSDPLLRMWKKSDSNPIIVHPANVKPDDFRDPSSGWREEDGFWRVTVGGMVADDNGGRGISILYKSKDFVHWDLEADYLHEMDGSGMWECPDFFPIAVEGANNGLDPASSFEAENYLDSYKYVMKASLAISAHDHYTIGTYSTKNHKYTLDDPAQDMVNGPRYDYGKFYASKTFYDPSTGRRILWSWVNESDSQQDDIAKGWASVQAVPRTLWLDPTTSKNLLQWPIKELESLRGAKASLQNVELLPTDVVKVAGGNGPQLDILVDFERPNTSAVDARANFDLEFDCSQGGSAHRGVFGPFGILVHANDALEEQTGIFFYVTPTKDGLWKTRVCSDQSRSSLAPGLDTTVYGTYVTILPTEDVLSLRVLVDHSIVETFVQRGRLAITSRVYPTAALGSRANLFLFNNGTTPVRVKNLDVYQMGTAQMNTL